MYKAILAVAVLAGILGGMVATYRPAVRRPAPRVAQSTPAPRPAVPSSDRWLFRVGQTNQYPWDTYSPPMWVTPLPVRTGDYDHGRPALFDRPGNKRPRFRGPDAETVEAYYLKTGRNWFHDFGPLEPEER